MLTFFQRLALLVNRGVHDLANGKVTVRNTVRPKDVVVLLLWLRAVSPNLINWCSARGIQNGKDYSFMFVTILILPSSFPLFPYNLYVIFKYAAPTTYPSFGQQSRLCSRSSISRNRGAMMADPMRKRMPMPSDSIRFPLLGT